MHDLTNYNPCTFKLNPMKVKTLIIFLSENSSISYSSIVLKITPCPTYLFCSNMIKYRWQLCRNVQFLFYQKVDCCIREYKLSPFYASNDVLTHTFFVLHYAKSKAYA